MRYFLELSYNGSPYHGWQRQPNAISVQQTIEDALSTILRKKIEITGAGRTDTGVHASQMFAHLDIDEDTDFDKLLISANRMIGKDIALKRLIPVIDNAHARFDAVQRTYKYFITSSKNPFLYNFTTFIHYMPDLEMMNKGGEILCETDDFTSFAKLHSDNLTNICKVTEAQWKYNNRIEGLEFTIVADRFLRNMVRAVVGTLVSLGAGKINLNDFKDIIVRKDRGAAGMSMPAQGLFLHKIDYPSRIFI